MRDGGFDGVEGHINQAYTFTDTAGSELNRGCSEYSILTDDQAGRHGVRELGFKRVLLVEGQSDIVTIQQFLRAGNKDHKILPLHLGGRSLMKNCWLLTFSGSVYV